MREKVLEDGALESGRARTSLKLEMLDTATNTLREVLKLVTEGAEVEDLSLAERKAKELYRTALGLWAKLKERRLMRTYEHLNVSTT